MAEDSTWPRSDGGGAMTVIGMRTPDDRARRFADLIKLSGLGTRFIDRALERRLLEEGVGRFGLSLDEARGMLRAVAEDHGYVFEAETNRRARQVLARQAGKSGRISKRQFSDAANVLRDFSDDSIHQAEAKRQVKRIMIDNGWTPRRAGLWRSTKWYRQIQA